VEVPLGHFVPSIGLGDGAAMSKHGERRVNIIPQKEHILSATRRGFRHGEVEVGIDSMLGFDIDVHASQNRHFHAQALREPNVKEVVSQIKVGLDPHIGLA
jgi:hypothetical protein